ncbi:MAG TPA: hypothetical protein VLE27_10425 [Thermoanaerobaculia bacterium]|nr:hypothetical protein [Thermoanaerobaculia bacterium]
MRTRFLFPLLSLVPLSMIAGPVLADDVYLVNGRKFEGVVTETTDTQVRITMQGGTLSLPLDHVLQVDKGDSSLQEYLRRKEALKKGGSAREWLELARWAQDKELQQAGREAALAAAKIDPDLPGLAPVLRGYGYVFDEQVGRWIPYAESMRRKGFVLSGGQWITREEHAAKVDAWEAEEARRRSARLEAARAAREDRLALLAEMALVRDLVRQEQAPPTAGIPLFPYGYLGAPVYVAPGFPQQPGHGHRPGHGGGGRHHAPKPPQFLRVPGSLIPGVYPGSH